MRKAAILAALFMPTAAQAGSAPPIYGAIGAGVGLVQNVPFKVSGTDAGGRFELRGDRDLEPGAAVFGVVGYRFTPHIALEAQAHYALYHLDNGTLSGFFDGGATPVAETTFSLEGRVQTVAAYGAVAVYPFPDHPVSPVLGLGLGAAHIREEIDRFDGLSVSNVEDDAFLAATFFAGLEFAAFGRVRGAMRYQFHWAAADTEAFGEITAHTINGALGIAF